MFPKSRCFVNFDLQMSRYSGAQFCHIPTSKSDPKTSIFHILILKCASSYSGVQFLHIPTSKSGPNMMCFVHFDLKMCFSLQRRAIFLHPNFKKWSWSEHGVHFDLQMCFSLQRNFATCQPQKVIRTRQFFNILTLKCASSFSGVQFFHIPTSKSGPNMVCFVHFDLKMCFSLQRCASFHFSSKQLLLHPPL